MVLRALIRILDCKKGASSSSWKILSMAGRSYWTEHELSDKDGRGTSNYRTGYGDRVSRSYGSFQNETNPSYQQSRNSSSVQQSIPQSVPAGTVCTLCQETLFTNYDVQAHLASPRHLDMVVRYPMIPLQDVLIPASSVDGSEMFQSQDGKEILEELESSLGSEAVSNILMVSARPSNRNMVKGVTFLLLPISQWCLFFNGHTAVNKVVLYWFESLSNSYNTGWLIMVRGRRLFTP